MNKTLFLDRDGVINIDYGYVYEVEKFEWQQGIFELCKAAKDKNYLIIVITNQSGIARNYYSEQDLLILHDWMVNQFSNKGITIDKIYYCPHHIDGSNRELSINCNCRKPKTGLFEQAIKDFNIDLNNSLMIGDKETDLIPAQKVGINKRIQFNNDSIIYSAATQKIDLLNKIIELL